MQVETRPAHLDDWLDTLPYTNLEKCIGTLHWAIIETNKATLKPALRLELIDLYWPRYRYLLDNNARADRVLVNRTLQQRNLQVANLRRVAEALAQGCFQVIRDGLSKSLFRSNLTPERAILTALTAYGHSLTLGFQIYAPTPGNVWRDIHAMYSYAEAQGLLDRPQPDPDTDNAPPTSIRNAYMRICATELADPHQLESGDIWQVYERVTRWIDGLELKPFAPMTEAEGVFVIDLHHAGGPVSYSKLRLDRTTPHLRLLVCRNLAVRCRQELDALPPARRSAVLDVNAQKTRLLAALERAWGASVRRTQPRAERSDTVQAVVGITAAHTELDKGAVPADASRLEEWKLLNASRGGFGLYAVQEPQRVIRIGDLVALENPDTRRWMLSSVRWLMIEAGNNYKIGVQVMANAAKPVMVNAAEGVEIKVQPRPAFLLDALTAGGPQSILTSPGLYAHDARLQLSAGYQHQGIVATELLERTVAFERFTYRT